MKIKSKIPKMGGLGLIAFSKYPNFPMDAKGKLRSTIISKKEFRALQSGKTIDLNPGQCDIIDKKFPGFFEVLPLEDAKPVNPCLHNTGEIADAGPDTPK